MERIVSTVCEAEALDNLLARSIVGQNLTTYVALVGQKNADESDGLEELHMVILDNGYLKAPGATFQPVLQCVRCGSCLSVCPVYCYIGGHGYGSIYPGLTGAVLSPILGGYKQSEELSYVFSLYGACTETRPVKILLHELLTEHRKAITDDLKMKYGFEDFQMRMVGRAIGSSAMFKVAAEIDHAITGILSKQKEITVENIYNYGGYLDKGSGLVKGRAGVRDLPRPPKPPENFRSWFKEYQEGEKNS